MSIFLLGRVILSALIVLGFGAWLKYSFGYDRVKLMAACAFLAFLVYGILGEVVVENMFMNFESPEEANRYKVNKSIDDVLVSGDIALVYSIGADENELELNLFYYEDGGWKIPGLLFAHTRNSKTRMFPKGFVHVYRVNGLDKALVVVEEHFLLEPVGMVVIEDSVGSVFEQRVNYSEGMERYSITYYALVEGGLSGYELMVDGEKVL